MSIKIGDEITIPFRPQHHKYKTGVPCMVVEIDPSFVYVKRYNVKEQKWGNSKTRLDREFLEKLTSGDYYA